MPNSKKPENTPLEEHITNLSHSMLLMRKMQDQTSAEFLSSLGKLSMQELNVLNIIGDSQPCTMSEIAKQAVLSLSSITLIVDKLVRANLVKRVRSEEDRRIVQGELTSEGMKIYKIQIKHVHDIIHRMLSALSPAEQKSLVEIFQKLTQVWMMKDL